VAPNREVVRPEAFKLTEHRVGLPLKATPKTGPALIKAFVEVAMGR
jgi:hypothetical protein